MKTFDGITDGADALNQWFWGARSTLPEKVVSTIEPLLGLTKSPVDAVVKAAEVIYAHRDAVDAEALELAAGLAVLCQTWGYHGMDVENRGYGIAAAIRRDAGEKLPGTARWPDQSKDPAPSQEYALPSVPEVLAPPPAEQA